MKNMTMTYEIRVKGHLTADWSEWFEGLRLLNTADGETILSGPIRDQAALYGILLKIQELGLALISVNQSPRAHN
jgi:hypothetical protein